ncbi:hypothetical protein GQ600_3907 [Phytophthora cactorum]|nr:hypothetical protein GQ600_3907 [Phytophthora cactorum]
MYFISNTFILAFSRACIPNVANDDRSSVSLAPMSLWCNAATDREHEFALSFLQCRATCLKICLSVTWFGNPNGWIRAPVVTHYSCCLDAIAAAFSSDLEVDDPRSKRWSPSVILESSFRQYFLQVPNASLADFLCHAMIDSYQVNQKTLPRYGPVKHTQRLSHQMSGGSRPGWNSSCDWPRTRGLTKKARMTVTFGRYCTTRQDATCPEREDPAAEGAHRGLTGGPAGCARRHDLGAARTAHPM